MRFGTTTMMMGNKALMGLICLFTVACNQGAPRDDTPTRPDNLPQNAEWRGGLDGGFWISCEKTDGGAASIVCTTYWTDGDLHMKQEFKLCARESLTGLFSWHDWGGLYEAPTRPGSVAFVPVKPALIYTHNQIDDEITAKVRREFEQETAFECPTELIMN